MTKSLTHMQIFSPRALKNPVSLGAHPHGSFAIDITHFATYEHQQKLNWPIDNVQRISKEVQKHSSRQPLYTHLTCLLKDQLYKIFCSYTAPLIQEQYTPKSDMSGGIVAFLTIGPHFFHCKPRFASGLQMLQ